MADVPTKGMLIMVAVKDNHASRLAVRLARGLVVDVCRDTLLLVHAVASEYASFGAEGRVLAAFNNDPDYALCTRYMVVVQGEGQGLGELVADTAVAVGAALVVVGSQGLCNDSMSAMEAAALRPTVGTATTAAAPPLGVVPRRKPSRHATALALAHTLAARRVPLLVAKVNTVGGFTCRSTPGLRVMADLTPTLRHALGFMMGRLQPGRDNLVLAVGRALDGDDRVRGHALRLLTTFGVQAQVSCFNAERRRLLREASHRALPAAVLSDEVDVLVVQAPRTRDLSPPLVELLVEARTALLLWPADRRADGSVEPPPTQVTTVVEVAPTPSASAASSRAPSRAPSRRHSLDGTRVAPKKTPRVPAPPTYPSHMAPDPLPAVDTAPVQPKGMGEEADGVRLPPVGVAHFDNARVRGQGQGHMLRRSVLSALGSSAVSSAVGMAALGRSATFNSARPPTPSPAATPAPSSPPPPAPTTKTEPHTRHQGSASDPPSQDTSWVTDQDSTVGAKLTLPQLRRPHASSHTSPASKPHPAQGSAAPGRAASGGRASMDSPRPTHTHAHIRKGPSPAPAPAPQHPSRASSQPHAAVFGRTTPNHAPSTPLPPLRLPGATARWQGGGGGGGGGDRSSDDSTRDASAAAAANVGDTGSGAPHPGPQMPPFVPPLALPKPAPMPLPRSFVASSVGEPHQTAAAGALRSPRVRAAA